MGSCHGSNKSSNEKIFIQNENLEIFSLIWLDNTINKSQKNISIQQQFRTIINFIKIFQNQDNCEEYIRQMSKDECIIFIVNDQLGETIIPYIHDLQQIFSIYIYSLNKNIDQQWINQFKKIKSICTDYDEILNQIEIDQIRCKYIKDEILLNIFHIDTLNNSNDEFLYSQILIDILLQMDPMIHDMNDLISLCRNQYKGNKYQLNILREFQQNYSSDNAIWWLTRDTILSEILNKALKTKNLDLIFLFRFFLHDIEQQLQQYQCLIPIKVYRYQLMSNKDLQLLKDSIGQFISINNFLLTNVNRDSVLPYHKLSSNNNDYQSILFEISADFNLDKIKPFSNITLQKYSQNDQIEVLFMLGSIFELNNIHQDDNNLWIIEMRLTSKTNRHLKSTFEDLNNDNNDDDINLLSFGYILQKMNKFNETEKYYYRLFNELSDEDEHIGSCCLNLGNIAFIKTDYDSSLEWLLKSLEISFRTLQSDDKFFALIYNSLGHVYNAKNNSKSAIESYNNAIIIWKQSIDENYLNIAECMNNIGIIYKQEKDYLLALKCFKETLNILEKYLSHDHFDLCKTHSNIASVYRHLEQYDLALEHYNISLKILEKYYSSDYLNIAKVLGNIGIVYALEGEQENALFYYKKAADIYRHILPLTHINNIKIDQLIQNVSLANPRLSFGTIDAK